MVKESALWGWNRWRQVRWLFDLSTEILYPGAERYPTVLPNDQGVYMCVPCRLGRFYPLIYMLHVAFFFRCLYCVPFCCVVFARLHTSCMLLLLFWGVYTCNLLFFVVLHFYIHDAFFFRCMYPVVSIFPFFICCILLLTRYFVFFLHTRMQPVLFCRFTHLHT